MSTTTLIKVWPGERVEHDLALRNSYGGAMRIWRPLGRLYIRPEWSLHDFGGDKALWRLATDPRLSRAERAVLAVTFDDTYVLGADFTQAAADLEAFERRHPVPADSANHLPAIAAWLRACDAPAAGFWWTSVTEAPFERPWDEAAEAPGPFDWSKAWSLYDQPGLRPESRAA